MWVVTEFVEEHNHDLETPVKSRCLRSHRAVPASHIQIVEGLHKVGVGAARSLQFLSDEFGGPENVPYIHVDMKNALTRRRQEKYKESAALLLQHFQTRYGAETDYSYEIEVDDENRLTACFWVDSESKIDYKVFGDVIYFDTTYKTNQYDMPFGPFVGVNQHKQTILLGGGLLFGETVEDFKWLFKTWLAAMGGVPPKAIVTDQDPAIMRAVSEVFPDTHHVLCLWHIRKKFPEKLNAIQHKHPDFRATLDRLIHGLTKVEEFEHGWMDMLSKYQVQDNTWLQQLYAIKHMWVPAYTRSIFLARMTTTQRSGSINSLFDHFVSHKTNLLEFVLSYERCAQKRRADELAANAKSTFGSPVIHTK